MTRRGTIGLLTGGTLGSFALLAFIAGRYLGVQGTARGILIGAVSLLGLGAAFVVYRYLSRTVPKRPEEDAQREIDELFSEVREKLRAARLEGGNVARLPVLLFLGPPDSTKTTLVEQSGIAPELLAGEIYRGEAVVPTRSANVWLGEESLFVEAGGKLLADAPRWARLIGHLRPARLGAVFGRGRQPPRIAVVCFPCEGLLKSGRSESVPAAAREIRERLHEWAGELGVRLPVYVLFTKADRIRHFEEYVQRFSHDEVREVLGATLPLDRHGRSGAYAERESERLAHEFERLFHSLALRRLDLLEREADAEARAGVYEFPRELRKLRDAAVRFLVELGRPSPLSVSPIIRGFYLTGVRPVVPEESERPEPARGSLAEEAPVGATMVFDRGAIRAAPSTPAPSHGPRRVPQWTFVRRLFREILLGDGAAMRLTAGGTRVNLLRRALAGGAVGAGVVLLVGLVVSFINNGRLEREVLAAMEGARSVEPARRLPGHAELQQLAALGELVRRLRAHEVDGRPWRLRWGLYKGAALLPSARRLFFDRFEEPLALPARDAAMDVLQAVPAVAEAADRESGSGTAYDSTYRALKAYLVVTTHPDSSEVDFLAPVLTDYRLRGTGQDSASRALVGAQFEVYALELPHGNPYAWPIDDGLVSQARQYLNSFAGADQVYRRMIESASSVAEPVRFDGPVVRSEHVIRGAYTREGWTFIRSGLDENIERLLAGEEWVTGPRSFSEQDLERLRDEVWERYIRDYVAEWRRLLAEARVGGFANLRTAARTLESLAGPRSPLLGLLARVTHHTSVPSDTVRAAFQPVHVVLPPDTSEVEEGTQQDLIVDANRPWIDAVGGVYQAVQEAVDAAGADRDAALERAADATGEVGRAVLAFRQEFTAEEWARPVDPEVVRLLERPADAVRRLARGAILAGLGGELRRFCDEFAPVLTRYPFDPDAAAEASIDDVNALLKPGDGTLWTMPQDELADVLTGRPGNYRVRSDASPRPTDAFVRFLNEATRIAEALYPEGATAPRVGFGLAFETSEALPRVIANVDSRVAEWTQTRTARSSFEWAADAARSASISGEIDGRETTLLREDGSPWALFKLLDQAEWTGGGRRRRLRWRLADHGLTLAGELILNVDFPILNARRLGNLQCVSSVTR